MGSPLPSVVLGLGVVAAAFIIRDAALSYKKLGNTIEVRGLDERTVKSDQATWQIRYSVAADNVRDLYTNSSSMSSAVVDFLTARGFSKEEIQKAPLVISDRNAERYSNSNAQAMRYSGRGAVSVSTRKVDQVTSAAESTDALVERGVILEGSEINYYFTGLNVIKPDMLKAASQSATAAAESLARDTGVALGKVKQVSQGLFSITSPFGDVEYSGNSSLMKQVRVVTRAEYTLE